MPSPSATVAPEAAKPVSPDTQNAVPVLIDFLNTVPHQLTVVLVALSPYISKIRSAAEITSWRSSWYDSWLFLAVWWAVCLLAEASLRYLLPITLLFTLSVSKWTSHPRSISPPITEHNLQTTISDLNIIQSLIPTFPNLPLISPSILLRVSAILYIPYLLLTYFVSLRVILGTAGTLLLTWRAPWAVTIRSTLWRSALVRWSLYHTWSQLTGQPLPPHTLSLQPVPTSQPVNSIRFLFTIYENQRWWMGLDWTAALLPGERPSWCSAAQHAVSPPNAFELPEETTVFLAVGSGGKVKRTAMWKWEEEEWRVLVRKDGGGLSRVERALPTGKEESPSGSRLKAAGKMKQSSSGSSIGSPSGHVNGDGGSAGTNTGEGNVEDDLDEPVQEEPTDADGWVYGDNKWEGQSGKGGMGKYTRYRRWTRVATVSEVVELVEDDEVGIQRRSPSGSIYSGSGAQSTGVGAEEVGSQGEKGKGTERDSVTLRQRLNSALNPESPHPNS